jgi:hypothetical protein
MFHTTKNIDLHKSLIQYSNSFKQDRFKTGVKRAAYYSSFRY